MPNSSTVAAVGGSSQSGRKRKQHATSAGESKGSSSSSRSIEPRPKMTRRRRSPRLVQKEIQKKIDAKIWKTILTIQTRQDLMEEKRRKIDMLETKRKASETEFQTFMVNARNDLAKSERSLDRGLATRGLTRDHPTDRRLVMQIEDIRNTLLQKERELRQDYENLRNDRLISDIQTQVFDPLSSLNTQSTVQLARLFTL